MTVNEVIEAQRLKKIGSTMRAWYCPHVVYNISMSNPTNSIELPLNYEPPEAIGNAECVKHWYETSQLLCIIYKNPDKQVSLVNI